MKHRATKFFGLFAILATLLSFSCTESNSLDYDEVEQIVFDDWMAKYHPELLDNYQEDSGYYIDLVTQGDTSGRPISDTTCWVRYDMTAYDLNGNVCITRNDLVAWQQGSFSEYTHYTPYYRLSYILGEDEDEDDYTYILECTHLAFTTELKVGDRSDVLLYNGAEFTLYSPSSLTTTDGVTGSGGYEGQYSLGTLPIICVIKVTDVIIEPLAYEEDLVNAFAFANGGLTITPESLDPYEEDEDDEDDDEDDEDEDDEDEDDSSSDDSNSWTNARSDVPYIYINTNHTPNIEGSSFNYIDPYTSVVPDSPYYEGIAEVDRKVNIALSKYFSGDYDDEGELVGDDQTASVWYICRLLDGFIVDTNIDVVKEIVFNDYSGEGAYISYNADTNKDDYIMAWYYSIPAMRYGSWSSVVTVSPFAYGEDGAGGDSTSSTYEYNYFDYYSSYSSYYSGDYSSYYSSYYDDEDEDEDTTTVTITTEILPYTPLIFEVYVVSN